MALNLGQISQATALPALPPPNEESLHGWLLTIEGTIGRGHGLLDQIEDALSPEPRGGSNKAPERASGIAATTMACLGSSQLLIERLERLLRVLA